MHSSVIDITVAYASSTSGIVFSDWKTNGSGLSDHKRITFNIIFLEDLTRGNETKKKINVFRKKVHENEEKLLFADSLSNIIQKMVGFPVKICTSTMFHTLTLMSPSKN